MIDYTADHIDPRLHLVDFDKASPNTLKTLCHDALQNAKHALEAIDNLDVLATDDYTALGIIREFNHTMRTIDRYFGLIGHLDSVKSEPIIRQVYHELLPIVSDFYTQTKQSSTLYQLHKQILQSTSDELFYPHEKVALQKALQAFELSGVGLDDTDKATFADIQNQLSKLSAQFSDNVLDATKSYRLPLTDAQTKGMTKTGLAPLKSTKQDTDTADYVATLDLPMYLAVMNYNDDRNIRKTLYKAYTTRASDLFASPQFDNAAIMVKILQLRQAQAKLLGFDDFTDVSLATKMADNADEVISFLDTLASHAKPFALAEFDELVALGKSLGINDIQAWDIGYLSEKLREQKYNINQDQLRPYFPINQVLTGFFEICRVVFGIDFVQQNVSVWHDDVLFFEIYETKDKKLLGAVYLDLYTNAGKKGGAWLSDYQSRHIDQQNATLPVGFIVANFTPPSDGMPACLSFDEVTTLFHEFGHALHHLLTKIDIASIAGISGVEWDAVELPSQFMENFALNPDGITKISRHIDTNQPLPAQTLQAILASKNFQSGLLTLRQLEFALFDMYIHQTTPNNFDDIQNTLQQVRQQVSVIPTPNDNRFANAFGHIFAGGYASGYYSYKWAELLSADAFLAFEENGVFDQATGQKFKEHILSKGSSCPTKDNFRLFRGKEPTLDALLIQSGFLTNNAPIQSTSANNTSISHTSA